MTHRNAELQPGPPTMQEDSPTTAGTTPESPQKTIVAHRRTGEHALARQLDESVVETYGLGHISHLTIACAGDFEVTCPRTGAKQYMSQDKFLEDFYLIE